jgi:hypothetical protein
MQNPDLARRVQTGHGLLLKGSTVQRRRQNRLHALRDSSSRSSESI